MTVIIRISGVVLLLVAANASFAAAQTSDATPAQDTTAFVGDWAWRPLFEVNGLQIEYLFYPEADTKNNGVVLLLTNTTETPLAFRFTVVFRAGGEEREQEVEGVLAAGERRTGDEAGLFWVPFPDGRAISELGLRRYRVGVAPGGASLR